MLDPSSSPLAGSASTTTRAGLLPGSLTLQAAVELTAQQIDPTFGDSYAVSIDGNDHAEITVGSPAALNRLRTVIASSGQASWDGVRTTTDSAQIATRSVHECFYGERWAPEDRLAVLRFAAAVGATTYAYGPSADRRTGGLWRDPYEGVERDQLAQFARAARDLGVEPIWRVSPAAPLEPELAIRMTEAAELAALVAKVHHVMDLGFERILIAFDDLTAGLDAESAARFVGSGHPLAAAHASVIRLLGEAVGHHRLIACPLHYWGADPSPDRREFGPGVPPEVPVIWTGPAVISDTITAAQARAVADELGHPLWLWDNYPVNDWDMDGIAALPLHAQPGLDNLVIPRRLPLAAATGRDPELADVVLAMGCNLAMDPWTGLPAALTLLDFAWSGARYRPESSWHACVELLGVDPEALAVLADAAGPGSGVPSGMPSRFASACARIFVAQDPLSPEVIRELEAVVQHHIEALGRLRSRPSRLTRELQPWLVELGRQCQFAKLAIATLRATTVEKAALAAELGGALGRRSLVSVGSGMGRALAEYARGLVAGGVPEVDVPNATSFGH